MSEMMYRGTLISYAEEHEIALEATHGVDMKEEIKKILDAEEPCTHEAEKYGFIIMREEAYNRLFPPRECEHQFVQVCKNCNTKTGYFENGRLLHL